MAVTAKADRRAADQTQEPAARPIPAKGPGFKEPGPGHRPQRARARGAEDPRSPGTRRHLDPLK